MSGALTGITRDVIAKFVFTEKPPLNILTSPFAREGECFVYIGSAQYLTAAGRLLFFPFAVLTPEITAAPHVYINFFFRGRGLYFCGPLRRVKNGFAFLVPPEVYKTPDIPAVYVKDISAKIYTPGFSGIQIECRLTAGYNVFENRLWLGFSKENALSAERFLQTAAALYPVHLYPHCRQLLDSTKRILYFPGKKIPDRNLFTYPASVTTDDINAGELTAVESELANVDYDVYIPLAASDKEPVHTILGFKSHKPMIFSSDIEEKLFLLPVCRFLGREYRNTGPVLGRVEPLSILCITHSLIILGTSVFKNTGGAGASFPLTKGGEYMLSVKVAAPAICRILKIGIIVSKIYNGANGNICAVCAFSKIQEEDRRFLYEKFYQTVYK